MNATPDFFIHLDSEIILRKMVILIHLSFMIIKNSGNLKDLKNNFKGLIFLMYE